jgi:hypothetical protein
MSDKPSGLLNPFKDIFYQFLFYVDIYILQEELKEVFEGSCQLIPIKLIANECIKLADQFVPELVETLASEMNPDTVCSVAGEPRNFIVTLV